MTFAARTIIVILSLFLLGDFALLSQSCSSPSDSAYNYCGTPGSTIPGGWFEPGCRAGNCGTETWYVQNLPNGVTASITPASTTLAQATTISLNVATSVSPGLYSFQVGAVCSPTACGVATATLLVFSPAHISFNGTDITGTTQTVVVGEQVNLIGSVSDSNGSAISQQWSVPGRLIKSYDISATDERIVDVPTSDLAQASVAFHWIDAVVGRTVTYTVTFANGQTSSAQVTFNILSPTPADSTKPLLTGVIGTAVITQFFGQTLSLRNLNAIFTLAGNYSGMVITSNLSPPPPDVGAGLFTQDVQSSTYLLQVGSSMKQKTLTTGKTTCTTPYAFDSLYTNSESDTPTELFTASESAVYRTDMFQAFLLWQPALPNSIRVPLGVLEWTWSGGAVRVPPSTTWSLVPSQSAQSVIPFVSANAYPSKWTNFLNGEVPVCTP